MNFQNGSFLDDYEDRKKGRKEEREREKSTLYIIVLV